MVTLREYYLRENPFMPDSFDYDMVGRKKEWEKITERLSKAFNERGSKTIILLGDYGYGKTFTLEKIEEAITKDHQGIYGKSDNLVIPIKMAESEPETKISLAFVTKVFKVLYKNEKVVNVAKKAVKSLELSSDFKKVLSSIASGEEEGWDWLIGESTKNENKKLGVRSGLYYGPQAIDIFFEFLKITRASEIKNVLILIDEFEYIVNVYSNNKITQMLHMFKEIFDESIKINTIQRDSISNCIFLVAMTPTGWNHLTEMEAHARKSTGGGGITPWLDRINVAENLITLEPLNRKEVEQLIESRVSKKRLEFIKGLPYKTFPFVNPGFIDVIYNASKGVPRKVIDYCDSVLDHAVKEELKEINEKEAKEILKKLRLFDDDLA